MRIRVMLKYGCAVLAVAALVLPLAAAGAAGGKLDGLTRVSRDGIVDGLALHRSEVQPSLAADGAKTLVGAFEVGRIFNGGSSAIGFATSADGGNRWHEGLLPLTVGSGQKTTAAGVVWRAGDPSVAYDASHHAWLVASTGLNGTGGAVGLFVNGSKDGNKWSGPVVAHAAGTGDAPDNGSLACDDWPSSKGYGTCYLAYDNTASSPGNQLQLVTSTDGGKVWSAPVSTPDASTGTGVVALVQPPPTGAAPGTACGRLVVSYAGSTASNGGVFSVTSDDCGATLSAHTQILPNMTATHTVAQTVRTGLVVSGSMDGAGAIYLAWQTRSFRTMQTTLAAAASAGDTNVKVTSVTGMVAGNALTIDSSGANPETVTITTVGTAGAGGTGVMFTPALAFAHASGAFVTVNGVASTSTAAPKARLALFYYSYPLAACIYVDNPSNTCSPRVDYVSSTDEGANWSDVQELSPGPPSLGVFPRTLALGGSGNGGPDLGSVLAAAVVPVGKLQGNAIGLFPVGIPVNGLDESMYAPKKGLEIGGAR